MRQTYTLLISLFFVLYVLLSYITGSYQDKNNTGNGKLKNYINNNLHAFNKNNIIVHSSGCNDQKTQYYEKNHIQNVQFNPLQWLQKTGGNQVNPPPNGDLLGP